MSEVAIIVEQQFREAVGGCRLSIVSIAWWSDEWSFSSDIVHLMTAFPAFSFPHTRTIVVPALGNVIVPAVVGHGPPLVQWAHLPVCRRWCNSEDSIVDDGDWSRRLWLLHYNLLFLWPVAYIVSEVLFAKFALTQSFFGRHLRWKEAILMVRGKRWTCCQSGERLRQQPCIDWIS